MSEKSVKNAKQVKVAKKQVKGKKNKGPKLVTSKRNGAGTIGAWGDINDDDSPRRGDWARLLEPTGEPVRPSATIGGNKVARVGMPQDRANAALELVGGSSHNLQLETSVTSDFIKLFLLPLITIAYTHGASSTDSNTSISWSAYQKLYATLVAMARSDAPVAQEVPEVVVRYAAAIMPKTVKCKRGTVSNKFNFTDSTAAPNSSYPIGSVSGVHSYYMYVPAVPVVNGLHTQKVPSAGDPEDDWGEWVGKLMTKAKTLQLTNNLDPRRFKTLFKDASAYSRTFPQFTGSTGAIGYSTQLFNASHIQFPALAGIVPYVDGPFSDTRMFANSNTVPAVLLALSDSDHFIQTKVPTKFKYLDLGEFFDVAAKWLGLMLSIYSKEKQLNHSPVPLTQLLFAIILRQEIAYALMPHVFATMDQSYALDLGNSQTLVSCLYGSNCYPKSFGLLLPDILVENIKAVKGLSLELGGMPTKKKKTTFKMGSVANYLPVLCVPSEPAWEKQYTYKDYTGAFQPVFDQSPVTNINLIDGVASTGAIIDFNTGAAELGVGVFNTWVADLRTFTNGLSVCSKEASSNAFKVIQYTRYVGVTSLQAFDVPMFGNYDPEKPSIQRKGSKSEIEVKPITVREYFESKQMVHVDSIYPFWGPTQYTTPESFFASNWTPALQFFIMPLAGEDLYPQQAVAQGEIGTLAVSNQLSSGISPQTTLDSLHTELAAQMVRGAFGDPSEMQKMVTQATEMGNGGFFSALLGPLADKIIPGIGNIVSAMPI